MSVYKKALSEIKRGQLGLNEGLPTGLPRYDEYLHGVQKGTYYLIGGNTGSGKSYFVNNTFILNPYDYLLNTPGVIEKVHYIYLSFEMVAHQHILRAIPRWLWLNYNIQTNVGYVLSRGKHRISQEIFDKVLESQMYFEKLEDSITFVDSCLGKSAIDKVIGEYALAHGNYTVEANGTIHYTPHDENLHTIIILDHYGLTKKEDEKSTKDAIDGLSKLFVEYRNVCNFTEVVLSQYNRDMDSVERIKKGMIEPQLSDFKDSAGSQEDADVVLGLADPFKYGHSKYKGYDIELLKSYFRGLHVLKNRSGNTGGFIGLNFFGDVGIFKEFPRSGDMAPEDYERGIKLK